MTESTIEGIAEKAATEWYTGVSTIKEVVIAAIREATEAQRQEIERLRDALKFIEKGLPVYYGDKPFTVTHEQVNKKLMNMARQALEKT